MNCFLKYNGNEVVNFILPGVHSTNSTGSIENSIILVRVTNAHFHFIHNLCVYGKIITREFVLCVVHLPDFLFVRFFILSIVESVNTFFNTAVKTMKLLYALL